MAEADVDGARRAAARIIETFCITEPCQIDVHDIAYDRGVLVREGQMSGAEGRLLRKDKWGVVRVRSNLLYPGRMRFAIAHELGHWERHMNLSQAWLCSSRDIHAYCGSNAEIEANAFAGELLMPTPLLRPLIHRGLSVETLCRIADEFQTSLTATAVRAVEEADEDAYVIFSRGGCVRWWKRSRKAERYLERFFAVRPNSFAFSCDTAPEDADGMQPVDLNAWFDGCRGDDIELWEESVYFDDLDTVMTLLSIA